MAMQIRHINPTKHQKIIFDFKSSLNLFVYSGGVKIKKIQIAKKNRKI
jgi:hypothetical protein